MAFVAERLQRPSRRFNKASYGVTEILVFSDTNVCAYVLFTYMHWNVRASRRT